MPSYVRTLNTTYEEVDVTRIKTHPANPRRGDLDVIKDSISVNGFYGSVVVNKRTSHILAGNHRYLAAKALGYDKVPVTWVDVGEHEEKRILTADNRTSELGGYDEAVLADLLQELSDADMLEGSGYRDDELGDMLDELVESKADPRNPGLLRQKFGCPPFSILDARMGPWIERKREWITYGINGVDGRDAPVYGVNGNSFVEKKIKSMGPSTSVFDPVLAELLINWFSPVGGHVLDPFAGGSTRGIVASKCGRNYVGVDVRKEQIDANQNQWATIYKNREQSEPNWIHGDSNEIDKMNGVDDQFDFLFSCPPYGDLEVYSEQPDDISTMNHLDFIKTYRSIIQKSVQKLADDRFACFVVGDFRDSRGFLQNFVADTISAFLSAGLFLYNDAVLITRAGSIAFRAGRPFQATRKLAKSHQYVLVFVKGDPRKATLACGDVELVDIEVT